MPVKTKTAGVRWISHKDMAGIVDKHARAVLSISGAKFTRNRKRGDYASLDADECPGIIELALIAPSVNQKGTRARKKS